MIRNNTELNNVLDPIIKDNNKAINEGMTYQSKYLNSDSFNKTFNLIEKNLNDLYEKARYFEDINEYIKTFVIDKINDNYSNCKNDLNNMQQSLNSNLKSNYISYSIKFLDNNEVHLDRDGSIIPKTEISNSRLTASSEEIFSFPIDKIERNCKYNAYSCSESNINNLLNDKIYRAIYLTDSQDKNIIEEISISFKEAVEMNSLNLNFTNCDIVNIKYFLDNGQVEYDYSFDNGYSKLKTVKMIKITLAISLSKTLTYSVDSRINLAVFWDTIIKNYYSNTKLSDTQLAELCGRNLSKPIKLESFEVDESYTTTESVGNQAVHSKTKTEIIPVEVDPTFITVTKYLYDYSLDNLKIAKKKINETSCFISQDIDIGEIDDKTYIELNASYALGENSSIEYFIIDGQDTIPILPSTSTYVNNEKVLSDINTMFKIDDSVDTKIKCNGLLSSISLYDIENTKDFLYTISYKPILNVIKPKNNSIKIKVIIRNYDRISKPAFINKLTINRFGGCTLWQRDDESASNIARGIVRL